eukprot:EG_transcript_9408
MAAAGADLPYLRRVFVHYDEWLAMYEKVKKYREWGDAFVFLQSHPAAVNNRKNGLDGCTLLHQAAYWDCDSGIFAALRDYGANPHLRNWEGKTAADMSRTSAAETTRLIATVFGEDDEQNRFALLQAAKLGRFGEMMQRLQERPHLVNTQGYKGWAVIHQVAFHGPSESLVNALVNLGASMDLKTHDGETADDILRRTFPNSTVSMTPRPIPVVAVGSAVAVHPTTGATYSGTVLAVDDRTKTVSVRAADREVSVPRCRVSPLPLILAAGDLEGLLSKHTCFACCDTRVPPGWTISPNCTTLDHPYCADCLATFLWVEYTTSQLPFKCCFCHADLNLNFMPGTRRAVEDAWPPGRQRGQPKTTIDFVEFQENVERRLRDLAAMGEQEREDQEVQRLLTLLQETKLGPIEGVQGDVPLTRACPRCGLVIEYVADCKHVPCPTCKHRYCFVCLRDPSQHSKAEWDAIAECSVAPIQTSIPSLAHSNMLVDS